MKISGDISRIQGIYDKQKNIGKVKKTSKAVSQKDKVSISGKAKDYQSVFKALKDIPDIRKAKIEEMEKKYPSGSYKQDGKDVAAKIIQSFVDKKV